METSAPHIPCPLCSEGNAPRIRVRTQEKHGKQDRPAAKCSSCGLLYLDDYRDDRSALYDAYYGAWGSPGNEEEELVAEAKREAFRHQLAHMLPHLSEGQTRLLDVGTGKGYLMDIAASLGLEPFGIEPSEPATERIEERHPGRIRCATLRKAKFDDSAFDIIAMTDVLEHIPDPVDLLTEVHRVLAPGGLLFLITPNTDSRTQHLLGKHWFQYKHEHVTYWNAGSLGRLLAETGFAPLEIRRNVKRFNLSYYYHYFRKYSLVGLSDVFVAAYHLLPRKLRATAFSNPLTGEMLVVARRKDDI